MRPVFADTSYWIALTNAQDALHKKAKAFALSPEQRPIVTTEPVLIEYLNYFAAWGSSFRERVVSNVEDILQDSATRVIPHDREFFLAGLALYRARLDKGYSLTDCISMQAMRREGLAEVLSNDRHFEQEGFRALLRDS
jgi:predicted nucleic acid-binding protein